MLKLSDFTKGGTAFITTRGHNALRRDFPSDGVEEVSVVSVGRKYVTVGPTGTRFRIADYYQKTDEFLVEDTQYGSPRRLYLTKEAYLAERELTELRMWVRKDLVNDVGKLSADQLKRIRQIAEEPLCTEGHQSSTRPEAAG